MTGFTEQKPGELQLQRMRQRALRDLGFDEGATVTVADVKEQFRMMVKQGHPDTATIDHGLSGVVPMMQDLRDAKDALLTVLENENV